MNDPTPAPRIAMDPARLIEDGGKAGVLSVVVAVLMWQISEVRADVGARLDAAAATTTTALASLSSRVDAIDAKVDSVYVEVARQEGERRARETAPAGR
jgi:hypothetical protein